MKLKYSIGQKIKTDGILYQVIGFEYVKGRGTRYILLHAKGGDPAWIYLYDFEIEMLL